MEILKFPDPRLFKPCKEVKLFTPELKVLLECMFETMVKNKGVGLAANQVGLDYRMFVMQTKKGEQIYLVNPEIIEFSKLPSDLAEGCLSAPGDQVKLYRPSWVKVAFRNADGKGFIRTFMDIDAICVQHEIEHLEGKSFLENKAIPKKTRITLAKKWGFKIK